MDHHYAWYIVTIRNPYTAEHRDVRIFALDSNDAWGIARDKYFDDDVVRVKVSS